MATFDLALLCTSLAAAVIAGVLLALEFFASPRIARVAPGVMAVLLTCGALAAASAAGLGWLAIGSAALAALLLTAWSVSFEAVHRQMVRLLTAKTAWASVLAVSLIASRYLAAHVLHTIQPQASQQSVDLEDLPVRLTAAFTDQGRSIPLFHFKIHSSANEIQQFIDANEKDRSQIIRLFEPNPASNCHGWVFTGGEFGIRDSDVAAILSDNGYAEVSEPVEGDLAVYISNQRVTHSGLVRTIDKHAPILVESKWGPLGIYLHAIDKHPFGGAGKFYRAARPDHLLVFQRSGTASEAALSMNAR